MLEKYGKSFKKLLFFILLVILLWSFFAKDNYRSVEQIHPDTTQEPVQTDAIDRDVINFNKGDYKLELSPVYDFEISAFIAHKLDYSSFRLSQEDTIYPVDLLLIWGDNVRNKLYQSKDLHFSQDSRQGRWIWYNDLGFNNNQAANEHIIPADDEIEEKLKSLSVGDQIKIRGQLVNVHGTNDNAGQMEKATIDLKTSTVRTDSGPGACEIIYVKELEVLEKANPIPNSLFGVTYRLLILLIIGNILWFIVSTLRVKLDKPTAFD